ncbi:uncharacterized protein LOC115761564 isoform X4 [Drosophila novamexicana]|uniref:uncharacterized protein LOC115761564 isoform X4 n=1 Tax=Drosophila novamexicana TaxID=47314 RepID=UPI0011E5A165|nr:uncharacterized protein LOC115761564 isoform X4 [Drosophila novamexicana]
MNILKLKKCCCCCVDLRCGCVIIYVIEFFFAVCGLCLGEWSENNHFWIVLRIGYMTHLIGTVFLLMGIILLFHGLFGNQWHTRFYQHHIPHSLGFTMCSMYLCCYIVNFWNFV